MGNMMDLIQKKVMEANSSELNISLTAEDFKQLELEMDMQPIKLAQAGIVEEKCLTVHLGGVKVRITPEN